MCRLPEALKSSQLEYKYLLNAHNALIAKIMLSTTLSLSLFYNSNKLYLNFKRKSFDIYFTSSYNFILLWMVSFFSLCWG